MTTKLTLRAVPERTYTRQHHASGYEHAPSISFHESTNSGLYLHDETTGEVGLSVNGSRRMTVGGITRFESDVLVLGNIIGSAGNTLSPIVDLGNIDQNFVPNITDTYDIGTTLSKWSNVFATSVYSNNVSTESINTTHINALGDLSVAGNVSIPLAFGTVTSNVVASSSNTYSIGTNDIWWNSVYGNTIIGNNASLNSLTTSNVASQNITSNSIHATIADISSMTGNTATFDAFTGNSVTSTTVLTDSIDIEI